MFYVKSKSKRKQKEKRNTQITVENAIKRRFYLALPLGLGGDNFLRPEPFGADFFGKQSNESHKISFFRANQLFFLNSVENV